jgi:hypothetical protein
MRLLHTETFAFAEFYEPDVPEYAILSHRWEADEVTFQDVSNQIHQHKAGWAKVRSCCAFALKDGWQWVWIDTCCIEKSSSAELSESINSMFRWYESSAVCYAYLYDVAPVAIDLDPPARLRQLEAAMKQSEWFRRGWTLQELLAPKYLLFIASDWVSVLGTKASLRQTLSNLTGISGVHIVGQRHFEISHYSIAERMSWASHRRCTRVEDIAYCLLGIFNVNMPLLYGEGQKAFLRLQLELLKASNDESIFAWRYVSQESSVVPTVGLLAPSPDLFSGSRDMLPFLYDRERPPFLMTNKGLRFEPKMVGLKWSPEAQRWQSSHDSPSTSMFYVVGLNCRSPDGRAYILLQSVKGGYMRDTFEMFHRFRPDIALTIDAGKKENVLLPDDYVQDIESQGLGQRKRIYVPQRGYQAFSGLARFDIRSGSDLEDMKEAHLFAHGLDPRDNANGIWRHISFDSQTQTRPGLKKALSSSHLEYSHC